LIDLHAQVGNVDIIVECSGSSEAVQAAIPLLGVGGVLVLLSITGGQRTTEIDFNRVNFEFVTGNKTMVGSVNSNAGDFRAAIADLQEFERLWPGLVGQLITRRLASLQDGLDLMESTRGEIKAVIDLA
jgi:threonine dehydrogenase-like Zn-dependent dehydrogenase